MEKFRVIQGIDTRTASDTVGLLCKDCNCEVFAEPGGSLADLIAVANTHLRDNHA